VYMCKVTNDYCSRKFARSMYIAEQQLL